MIEHEFALGQKPKMCLLGASFDTGNLGVSTLAESSIKCILKRWPDAQITLLASGYTEHISKLNLDGVDVVIKELPIRFSKNIFLSNHFCLMMFYAVIIKLLPFRRVRNTLVSGNKYFRAILETDLVVDITGGDSFSDIYGLGRFVRGLLHKILVLQLGKKLVLLPQTYGPFKRKITREAARYVLKRSSIIYSRDRQSMKYVRGLLKNHNLNGNLRFVPDVGFVLNGARPKHLNTKPLFGGLKKESILVGLNVSGLLFNGGYTRNNMFGLQMNYRELVYKIIDLLLQNERIVIILIPHVYPPKGYEVESDLAASRQVFQGVNDSSMGRVYLVDEEYDHNEIKYIIGMCNFFIGSRMHSCIAAMSQCIPAVGLAYSKKFEGVFESIGMADCVADAHNCDEEELLEKIGSVIERREQIREHLENVIPKVKQDILNIFNS